jgi:protease IV
MPPYQAQMGGSPRNMPPMGPPMGAPMGPGYMPMMPPMMMPPMMPYPPGKPPRSFTRAIFLTLATSIFGFSILANIYLLMLSGLTGGRGSQQSSIVEGDPHQLILSIPVNGVIQDSLADRFERMMNQAEKNPDLKAIVLEIDTPGGTVGASDRMYMRILDFKAAHPSIPVITSMGSFATSGGYYIACGTNYIFAEEITLTGNIGVLLQRINVSKLAEKWGLQDDTVAAPAVGFKTAGSPFKAPTTQETVYWQGLIDEVFLRFKTVVTTGRPKLTKSIDIIADGRAYTAKDALALGLVDVIGHPKDAYKYLATTAGLNNPTVIKLKEPPSLLSLFGSSDDSKFSGASPAAANGGVQVNGVNVNFDASLVNSLLTPHLLYMWQGQ